MGATTYADAVISDPRATDLALLAHLYRRAGFGATHAELVAAAERGYEAVVEELLDPEAQPDVDLDLFDRYVPEGQEGRFVILGTQARHLYRMVNTRRPLEDKLALFWHGLFATADTKVERPWLLTQQIDTFRKNALADFRTILLELSKDPAMIYWLDNQQNTKDVHNENFGRELLELFSMGIGNYTEDDVKNCARAFTGWTIRNFEVFASQPYGKYNWDFVFRPEQHDYSEKQFLGRTGPFDGRDVIDIIVGEPATARFVASRLYDFFVSDEPDETAIDELASVFASTKGNIREVMRALLLSAAFRSEGARFAKVKSPVDLVVGIARLVGGYEEPSLEWGELTRAPRYMGQDILNPPSVEGWHAGQEWIDSGLLIERVNFASAQVSDTSKPGVRAIIDQMREEGIQTPEQTLDRSLALLGYFTLMPTTRAQLLRVAGQGGPLGWGPSEREESARRIARLLTFIVASREYQFG